MTRKTMAVIGAIVMIFVELVALGAPNRQEQQVHTALAQLQNTMTSFVSVMQATAAAQKDPASATFQEKKLAFMAHVELLYALDLNACPQAFITSFDAACQNIEEFHDVLKQEPPKLELVLAAGRKLAASVVGASVKLQETVSQLSTSGFSAPSGVRPPRRVNPNADTKPPVVDDTAATPEQLQEQKNLIDEFTQPGYRYVGIWEKEKTDESEGGIGKLSLIFGENGDGQMFDPDLPDVVVAFKVSLYPTTITQFPVIGKITDGITEEKLQTIAKPTLTHTSGPMRAEGEGVLELGIENRRLIGRKDVVYILDFGTPIKPQEPSEPKTSTDRRPPLDNQPPKEPDPPQPPKEPDPPQPPKEPDPPQPPKEPDPPPAEPTKTDNPPQPSVQPESYEAGPFLRVKTASPNQFFAVLEGVTKSMASSSGKAEDQEMAQNLSELLGTYQRLVKGIAWDSPFQAAVFHAPFGVVVALPIVDVKALMRGQGWRPPTEELFTALIVLGKLHSDEASRKEVGVVLAQQTDHLLLSFSKPIGNSESLMSMVQNASKLLSRGLDDMPLTLGVSLDLRNPDVVAAIVNAITKLAETPPYDITYNEYREYGYTDDYRRVQSSYELNVAAGLRHPDEESYKQNVEKDLAKLRNLQAGLDKDPVLISRNIEYLKSEIKQIEGLLHSPNRNTERDDEQRAEIALQQKLLQDFQERLVRMEETLDNPKWIHWYIDHLQTRVIPTLEFKLTGSQNLIERSKERIDWANRNIQDAEKDLESAMIGWKDHIRKNIDDYKRQIVGFTDEMNQEHERAKEYQKELLERQAAINHWSEKLKKIEMETHDRALLQEYADYLTNRISTIEQFLRTLSHTEETANKWKSQTSECQERMDMAQKRLKDIQEPVPMSPTFSPATLLQDKRFAFLGEVQSFSARLWIDPKTLDIEFSLVGVARKGGRLEKLIASQDYSRVTSEIVRLGYALAGESAMADEDELVSGLSELWKAAVVHTVESPEDRHLKVHCRWTMDGITKAKAPDKLQNSLRKINVPLEFMQRP